MEEPETGEQDNPKSENLIFLVRLRKLKGLAQRCLAESQEMQTKLCRPDGPGKEQERYPWTMGLHQK